MEDAAHGWAPIYYLPCGGYVLCRLRYLKLAYKHFACHELDPDAEFPLEGIAIRCTGVKIDKLACPAVKRLMKAFRVADDVIGNKRPVLWTDALDDGSVDLSLGKDTVIYNGDQDKAIQIADLNGARRTEPSDMVDIFKDFEREACKCGECGNDFHSDGIIAFFRRLFGRKERRA